MAGKYPVYVVQHNHFDPIWRRCWDRTFDYKGKRYRPYADLEEYFINIWLENAKKGAVWSEPQAVVFRKYLERNPERLEEMRELVQKGIIELTAGGETVADTNMPSGETLLRNLVMGQIWFEDTFGVVPTVGWLEDAFGQSAQMPQLFRGVGCKSVQKLSYKRVPGSYWKGLDGSVLYTKDPQFQNHAGFCVKIPPCPQCGGYGCDVCPSDGLADESKITDEMMEPALAFDYTGEPFSLLQIGGEEAVPHPRIAELVQEAREKYGTDFVWGGFGVMEKYFADEIAKVDDPNLEVSDQVEANPVSTGCYVSRIKIKQEMRRIENMINAVERWATVAHLMGTEYPIECLTEAWRNMIFIAFHDAITSTHIDAAYYELMDMMEYAECEAGHVLEAGLSAIESNIKTAPGKAYLVAYNAESWRRTDPVTVTLSGTRGCPVLKDDAGKEIEVLDIIAQGEDVNIVFKAPDVPSMGYVAMEIEADAKPIDSGEVVHGPGEVENECFKIRVSERGIDSIIDKRTGKEILDTSKYLANELILEEDIGHPWGTMQMPSFEEGLAKYTTGVKIRRAEKCCEIMLTGQYKGSDANTKVLSWRQSARIYKGVDRIDFRTQIDWDTAQRRIRVAFPTDIKTSEATYAIPYGALKRGPYEPNMSEYPSTNGDWPAINWVDVYDEREDRGVALLNNGTPSHKVIDGVIYMSVLRSPTDSWCLNEPEFYDCPDFDGARDAGSHEFFYALVPHAGDYAAAQIEKRGREFNNPMIIRGIAETGGEKLGLRHSFINFNATENVIVTAVKKAERDDSVVVRLAETAGKPGQASVSVEGAGGKASLVNFLEKDEKPAQDKIELGPFKIMTVKLSR